MFGFNPEHIHVYGVAFTGIDIPTEKEPNRFQLHDLSFGKSSSIILEKVLNLLKKTDSVEYRDFSYWLEHAKTDWNAIADCSADVIGFRDIAEHRMSMR